MHLSQNLRLNRIILSYNHLNTIKVSNQTRSVKILEHSLNPYKGLKRFIISMIVRKIIVDYIHDYFFTKSDIFLFLNSFSSFSSAESITSFITHLGSLYKQQSNNEDLPSTACIISKNEISSQL